MEPDTNGTVLVSFPDFPEAHTFGRAQKETGRITGKTIAFGMVERGGMLRAMPVEDRGKAELQTRIKEHVEAGAAIFTDELPSYDGLSEEFKHEVINHAVEFQRTATGVYCGSE
jgi:transposase-like protein